MENELPYIHSSAIQSDGSAELRLRISDALPVLDGHFPGNPIVPGYSLISWAVTLSSKIFGLRWGLSKAKGVKFVQPVRPGLELIAVFRRTIRDSEEDPVLLSFEYRCAEDDALVARGNLSLRYLP